MTADPIRIVHVLFRFDIGGLENGVINLVNRLEERSYSHVIVCLTDYDRTYCRRVQATNVEFRALHKREGNDPRVWAQMWRVLRETRPHVLHTRNFAALEMQTLGLMCGVKGRVHGEHGWDMNDLDGSNRKYRIARRILGHCAHRFVALSRELERYLVDTVRIPRRKVVQIYNGVDDVKFHPRPEGSHEMLTVGTVGRMKAVKNQTFLCRVFVALMRRRPELAGRVSLILVGSGPLEQDCRSIVNEADCAAHVLFRGDSDAVADDLRSMDVFVLPSLAEGISNTIAGSDGDRPAGDRDGRGRESGSGCRRRIGPFA